MIPHRRNKTNSATFKATLIDRINKEADIY